METRFFLISGLDPMMEKDDLWEKIKSLLYNTTPQVTLKGMVKEIHFQDIGLAQEDYKLTLVKLEADHEEHLDKLAGRKLSPSKSRIISMPVQVTKRCEAKLNMDEVSLIPDLTEIMEFLMTNLDIELLKDSRDYWIAGELYQVAIAVKMISKKFHNLPPFYSIEGSHKVTNSAVRDVQDFLNRKDLPRITGSNHTEELDLQLPYLVMMLCNRPKMMEPNACKLILMPNAAENRCCVKVTSKDEDTLAEFHKTFLENYHDTRSKYTSVSLDSSFPLDYKDLLKRFVTSKFKPIIMLENRKWHMTALVYEKEEATDAETFIARYTQYNKPSGACNMKFFNEVLQRRSHVEQAGVLTRSQESGHGDNQFECTESDDGEPEVIETYKIHRDPLQLKYFYLVNWEKFIQKASYMHVSVHYREGCLEIGTTDREQITILTHMVEEMLEGITTKVIPVSQLMNHLSEQFLFVKQVGTSHVSITGPLDTEAADVNKDNQLEARSSDSPEPERVLAEAKEHEQRRRRRELVVPTDNHERSSSLEVNRPITPTNILDTARRPSSPETNRPVTPENIPDTVALWENANSFQHSTGCQIMVGKGDITKLHVDAIVNAANRKLQNEGGLARAIAEAAGTQWDHQCKEAVRKTPLETGEVVATRAGKLPCKWVIHAVGPALHEYADEEDCLPVLKETFSNCLIEANNLGCKSMAIPAISAGSNGINPKKMAKVAVEAIREYLLDYPGQSVEVIQLIDIKEEIIEFFTREIKEHLTV